MITHDIEQGTDEWYQVRLGKPTASRFKDIYTSTGKSAAGADNYLHLLLAEMMAGKPLESYTNQWMERGTELEPEARTFYELEREPVELVGFVTDDAGTVGCSPDGLTASGGVEIKCPKAETHIKYMLAGKCPAEYYPQVQGCMWICERDSWDFISYHPDLKPFLVTVPRDDKYITGLEGAIDTFLERLWNMKEKLAA